MFCHALSPERFPAFWVGPVLLFFPLWLPHGAGAGASRSLFVALGERGNARLLSEGRKPLITCREDCQTIAATATQTMYGFVDGVELGAGMGRALRALPERRLAPRAKFVDINIKKLFCSSKFFTFESHQKIGTVRKCTCTRRQERHHYQYGGTQEARGRRGRCLRENMPAHRVLKINIP